MARPPRPLGSKDDDDSWGKLASDLLGVNLNQTPDFDFPEPDPLPSAPDETSPGDSPEASAPVEEPSQAEQPAVDTVEEQPHDDYWDALESWEWEEAASEAPPSRSEKSSECVTYSERQRAGRSSSRERRDKRARREERDDQPHTARAEEGRSRGRTVESRNVESKRSDARLVSAAQPPVEEDDFAAGLLDDLPPEAPPATPTPVVPPEPDEFAAGLLPGEVEEAGSQEEFAEADSAQDWESSAAETEEGEEQPRRRRRRRRRRGRGRSESVRETSPPEVDQHLEEPVENREFEVEAEEDREAQETTEGTLTGRRERHRSRRARPGESVSSTVSGESAVTESEAEVVPRRVYADVPSWEEAVSYLVRPRGEGSGERRGGRRPSR